MAEIVFNDVCKFYGDHRVIDHLNFKVQDKEFFVILGPSGAGKTTTLKMIAGVEPVSGGTISINGKIINDIPPDKRRTAMVFESYALYSHLSVFENIAFPLFAPGMKKLPASEIETNVRKIAGLLNIDSLLERKPAELSGGQRQRVALGRALIREPEVFLLDEPLSHLDAKIRHHMRSELKNLQDSINSTIIYVTHDYNEALALGDRIAVLNRGTIQQIGTPVEIYYKPSNRFVAESLGDPPVNILEGKLNDINGKLYLEGLQHEFIIPIPIAIGDKLKSLKGKNILAGIRPQQVSVSKIPEKEFNLKGKVFVHEILGDEGILTALIGNTFFAVLTDPDRTFTLDETVYLTWDAMVMNYFSSETGENLLNLSDDVEKRQSH